MNDLRFENKIQSAEPSVQGVKSEDSFNNSAVECGYVKNLHEWHQFCSGADAENMLLFHPAVSLRQHSDVFTHIDRSNRIFGRRNSFECKEWFLHFFFHSSRFFPSNLCHTMSMRRKRDGETKEEKNGHTTITEILVFDAKSNYKWCGFDWFLVFQTVNVLVGLMFNGMVPFLSQESPTVDHQTSRFDCGIWSTHNTQEPFPFACLTIQWFANTHRRHRMWPGLWHSTISFIQLSSPVATIFVRRWPKSGEPTQPRGPPFKKYRFIFGTTVLSCHFVWQLTCDRSDRVSILPYRPIQHTTVNDCN